VKFKKAHWETARKKEFHIFIPSDLPETFSAKGKPLSPRAGWIPAPAAPGLND
jgi:hypothetical protein